MTPGPGDRVVARILAAVKAAPWDGHEFVEASVAIVDAVVAEAVAAEREACARVAERITQRRAGHEAFRGLDESEDAEGWRDLSHAERALQKAIAAAIRAHRRATPSGLGSASTPDLGAPEGGGA